MADAYPLSWPVGWPRTERLHPDKGGTDLEFAEMSEQFNKLLKEKSEAKP